MTTYSDILSRLVTEFTRRCHDDGPHTLSSRILYTEQNNKKLSYCCDSRSYCMQYFNAIFIVIATSRPLNKKIRSLSVCGSNNYCGSASASRSVRSPHTCAVHWLSDHWPVVYGTRARHCWQTSPTYSTRICLSPLEWLDTYGVSHFVFLWCILWLNDTYYSKSVWRDE